MAIVKKPLLALPYVKFELAVAEDHRTQFHHDKNIGVLLHQYMWFSCAEYNKLLERVLKWMWQAQVDTAVYTF